MPEPTDSKPQKKKRDEHLNKLNARQVETERQPGYYFDGGGLIMRITNNGGKRWLLRYVSPLTNKRREMGLGSAVKGQVSLREAREKAEGARELVRDGIDPQQHRKELLEQLREEANRASPMTFGQHCDNWMDKNLSGFRNPKHRAQWRMTLTKYAAPLRDMALAKITTQDIVDTLDPIWKEKPETARRTQGRIERMLDAATAEGKRVGENPARWRGHLKLIMPAQQKGRRKPKHHAAMKWPDLPTFIPKLRERDGIAARALEFTILTAARSGETRGATWAEIDLTKERWTIPDTRMKADREHRVPLAGRAVELLREMERLRPKNDTKGEALIFPGAKEGRPMSDMTLAAVLKRMEIKDATPHGFRSAFRDWAGEETDAPHRAIEFSLAHVIPDKTEAAYARGDLYQRRVKLMQDWADFLYSFQE